MSRIPENDLNVNEFIFTNINLNDNENFQLLHNDVNGCYYFQIYGRFFCQKKSESNFELKKIEFKLVHINVPGNDGPYYKVQSAELNRNNNDTEIDVDVTIKLEKPRDSNGNNVKSEGVDCTLLFNDGFDIGHGKMIDFHIIVNGVHNRNGRPCKVKTGG